jgi:hypothetical protein
MRNLIPSPIISVIADIAASRETHASLDSLYMHAEAPGDPPEGSKHVKALEWLRRVNKDLTVDPHKVLGLIIENYMEAISNPSDYHHNAVIADRQKLEKLLTRYNLKYITGGRILGSMAAPSRTLEVALKEFDLAAVDREFTRALDNVESEPREAISAASNILESFCKAYIAENRLDAPAKQDIKSVWTVVRKDLGFDPSQIEDQDLKTILTGLFATVEGIGALRTHASSAHGAGKTTYKIESRHARLAIHAAHTITLFALESWESRKKASVRPT